MIIFGGKELAWLKKSLTNLTDEGMTEYDRLRSKSNAYFTPKRNKHYARYQLLNMRTTATEIQHPTRPDYERKRTIAILEGP